MQDRSSECFETTKNVISCYIDVDIFNIYQEEVLHGKVELKNNNTRQLNKFDSFIKLASQV